MNDLIAYHFQISLNAMTWVGRIGLVIVPPIVYYCTYRICLGLQRSDREVLEHGVASTIEVLPSGGFIEVHQPLGPVDEHGHAVPLEYEGAPVPKQMNQLGYSGHPGRGTFFTPDLQDIADRAEEIEHENEREQKEMLEELQARNREQYKNDDK